MPGGKVVIVLEAQDREALTRIKEFGRGVDDTVAKLKAANPALEGTRVSVRNLTSAKVDATKASAQWSGVLTVLPGQLGSVASQATTLVSVLGRAGVAGGLVGGMLAVAGAGFALMKSLSDDIERLDNLSRQTGLAVSSLQAFEQAAREAGEAPETLARAFGRVNDAINDVLMGTANAGKAFKAIGVDLRGMVRDGASTEQILEATAKALGRITDPTLRAAAAQEILSIRGKAANATLTAIAKEGVDAYVQGMREVGIVTSEETNRLARDFDAMTDAWARSLQGWLMKLKAAAAQAVVDWRKLGAPEGTGPGTRFPIPGSAMGDVTFPGERPPPQDQDRRLAPSAEAMKAAEDAQRQLDASVQSFEDRRQAEFERTVAGAQAAAEQIGAIQGALAEDVIAGETLVAEQKEATRLEWIARQQDAAQQIAAIFGELAQEQIDQYEHSVQTRIGLEERIQASLAGEVGAQKERITRELTDIQSALDTMPLSATQREELITMQTELFSKRRILAYQTEADRRREINLQEQEAAVHAMELRASAAQREAVNLARMHIATAQVSGDTWAEFGGRFDLIIATMPTAMDHAMTAIQGSIQAVGQAFEESLFQLIKGNLDDFDDIWKTALDAALKQIIAFVASRAVQALLKLGADWLSGGKGPEQLSGPGSSSGGGSSDTDWIRTGITVVRTIWGQEKAAGENRLAIEQQTTTESGRRLTLEQSRSSEGSRQLTLEQSRSAAAERGAAAAEQGAAAAEKGAAAQAAATSSGSSFGFDFGTKMDMLASAARVGAGIAASVLSANPLAGLIALGKELYSAWSRHNAAMAAATKSTDAATAAAQESAQAHANVAAAATNFSGDLSVMDASFVDNSEKAQAAAVSLTGLTDEMGNLSRAAATAADDISAAASDIDRSVNAIGDDDRAGTEGGGHGRGASGADSGTAFGGHGTSGGAPDVTPDSPSISADGTGPGSGPGGVGAGTDPGGPGGGNSGSQQQIRRDARAIRADTEATVQAQRDLTFELERAAAFTAQLDLDITSTAAGTADTAIEAAHFAEALASGTVPAAQLQDYFVALSQEHGPAFTRAVIDVLEQLGLSTEQIGQMVLGLETLGQGVDVPVVYTLSTRGTPPPGAGGPSIPGPTERNNRQSGLLEGPIPGALGSPQWMQAHGGELVMTPNQATGLLRAIERGGRGDPEDRQLMVEQNKLLREQNRILREMSRSARGGRVVGAVV